MTKFNAFVATAVAAMFVSGGAVAATLEPADGQAPLMGEVETSGSATMGRAAVEAQAAQTPPADGQANEQPVAVDSSSALTRSEVEGEVAQEARRMGQFPDASGAAPTAIAE